ncbi:MAG: hypothetical protein V4529_17455 [Gemmatimonadota bacterium]
MTAVYARRRPGRCEPCNKVAFHSRGDAERFLKHEYDWLLASGTIPELLVVYPCPAESGFHLARRRRNDPD